MARRVVYVPIGVSNECPLQSLDGQEREIPRVLANRHRLGGQLQLKKFRVWNYKSFFDSRELELGSGFNVLVGQNNSGKTALLEALQPNQLRDKPHRSFET